METKKVSPKYPKSKICPFMSGGGYTRYCTGSCALIVDEYDYDDDGNITAHWQRCAFKDMLFNFSSIDNSMSIIAQTRRVIPL